MHSRSADAPGRDQCPAPPADPKGRAVVVTSVFRAEETAAQLGREAYSYRFAFRAFAPLLERWGRVSEVDRPESRLDYALWRARRENLEPLHFSFLPLHRMYLAQQAPNMAAPAWEFPEIPNSDFDHNPRNNWVRIADRLALIVTHSHFTRQAFLRAGVKTPVHVLPVPVTPDYFALPLWEPGQRAVLDCPAYILPSAEVPATAFDPWTPEKFSGLNLRARAGHFYRRYLQRRLPRRLHRAAELLATGLKKAWRHHAFKTRIAHPANPRLELAGVVYTTVFNPFDPRKNWRDLLSAYVRALGDCEDATLVVKLVLCPELTAVGVNNVLAYYRTLGLRHRCKLALMPGYLSDEQMTELARGSTYYLNASHAEGSCLPLQSFMAGGRPGVAPPHTGMAEYVNAEVGFPVASHPEPASWPHDPRGILTTTWHRLVWSSLHDQLRASYRVARTDPTRYRELARNGRVSIADFASQEKVWQGLGVALDATLAAGRPNAGPGAAQGWPSVRKAS